MRRRKRRGREKRGRRGRRKRRRSMKREGTNSLLEQRKKINRDGGLC